MGEPTWSLVLAEAKRLGAGGAAFDRVSLIRAVQRRDPSKLNASIGPIVQGMTRNAPGGLPSPCGTPLERVGHGRYRMYSPNVAAAPPVSAPLIDITPDPLTHPLVLVGCVRTKADHPLPARELYRSPLFARRRDYAERHAGRWYILSAEHGLVSPEALLEPYDTALGDQPAGYRRAWATWVVAKLRQREGDLAGRRIEIHAGKDYVAPLHQPLIDAGALVSHPVAGLRQGEHLAWYDRHGPEDVPTLTPMTSDSVEPAPAKAVNVAHLGARADDAGQRNVVSTLLEFGQRHRQMQVDQPPQFTQDPAANSLIIDDPFAFLLGVLFDQGITAERAWRAPYDLRLRLGHLDPRRLAMETEQVSAAIGKAPALHRFTERMPRWVSAVSRRVVEQYDGDAATIWASTPRATDVAARLRTFPGIGQKKAAMAVEILARDLRVPIIDLSGSDIAYDIHVRRVFLRTGLAQYDDLDHMISVARFLHPQRPGELDFPTWLIGRQWCSPARPNCGQCPLTHVCPRLLDPFSASRSDLMTAEAEETDADQGTP
jgi:uncharacterized HhH-GPD family protein